MALPNVPRSHSIHWGPKWNKKAEKSKLALSPLELGQDIHLLLPPDIRTPGSQAFGLWDLRHCHPTTLVIRPWASDWNYTIGLSWFFRVGLNYNPGFSGFPVADGRLWYFLSSKILWANSHNKSSLIFLYILLVLFLQRNLTNPFKLLVEFISFAAVWLGDLQLLIWCQPEVTLKS